MKCNYILAIDPSGNFHEGKGTTGYCILDVQNDLIRAVGNISASKYDNEYDFWKAHIDLIDFYCKKYKKLGVVIEDYVLYKNKAINQTNSRMETPKLIGLLQYHLHFKEISFKMQLAAEVKNRWTDEILVFKTYLNKKSNRYCLPNNELVNRHEKDAIRHAIHYKTFYN